jgi:hypothetical protein
LSSNPDKQVKNVSVTVPVLKVVTLPVTVDFDNKPAGVSNDILNVRYSTSSIKVGMIDSLNIKEVSIGTIDFNDISTGTNTFELDLKDLKGVTLLDDSVDSITVTVTVDSSEYASKYLNISNSQITVQGLADDETAKITQIVGSSVSIIGPTDKIDSYSASDITLTCNVENRNSDNVYDVIAVIKKTDSWVYCTCKAEIEITKK